MVMAAGMVDTRPAGQMVAIDTRPAGQVVAVDTRPAGQVVAVNDRPAGQVMVMAVDTRPGDGSEYSSRRWQ